VERQPRPGLIHHSDRGVQYASHEYVEQLQAIGAQSSMSAVGNPYDNAKAESFFKTLKQEEVYLKEYNSFSDSEQNLAMFIEKVYNEKRLHSSLGYLPPAEFEAAYKQLTGS
jgi:putative transposase